MKNDLIKLGTFNPITLDVSNYVKSKFKDFLLIVYDRTKMS